MLRDTIVYFGIIQHEYNNAMCRHALGIECLIKSIGYNAVLIGVSPQIGRKEVKVISSNTYAIREGISLRDRIYECLSANNLKRVLSLIGIGRIKTLIMADYRCLPMWKMKGYCKKKGIHFVIDVMDRFVAEKSFSSKIKKIDCDMRMRILYPSISRRIYICSSYDALLGEGGNTVVIPGVTWDQHIKDVPNRDQIVLSFLGRPGLNCEKEKIDWVIKAVSECGLQKRFILNLAGFDGKEFLKNNRELQQYVSENVRFLGRLNQSECMALLDDTDFSLVIRPDNLLSRYGFSTKIGEAFSRSIPVFATDTSDNSIYIVDGKSGYLCGCNYDAVKKTIGKMAKLNSADIRKMKEYINKNNPLNYEKFIHKFRRVSVEDNNSLR